MSNAISHVPAPGNQEAAHVHPSQHPAPAPKSSQAQSPLTNNRAQDTVKLSQGAQQALAAVKEATASSVPTTQEASHGNHQE